MNVFEKAPRKHDKKLEKFEPWIRQLENQTGWSKSNLQKHRRAQIERNNRKHWRQTKILSKTTAHATK
jgi:hypothetical protein